MNRNKVMIYGGLNLVFLATTLMLLSTFLTKGEPTQCLVMRIRHDVEITVPTMPEVPEGFVKNTHNYHAGEVYECEIIKFPILRISKFNDTIHVEDGLFIHVCMVTAGLILSILTFCMFMVARNRLKRDHHEWVRGRVLDNIKEEI